MTDTDARTDSVTRSTAHGTPAGQVRSFADITGWFSWTDQQLFKTLLTLAAPREPGHVVELGAYLGKSAAFMGPYVRAGERFVVCDLFGASTDEANAQENTKSYKNLTRQAFERNYRAAVGSLPEIIQAPSSVITQHVAARSVRLLHVDASHLYEHVRIDVASAVRLLGPGGVVIFDDYRGQHTPGVAAAVWGAVERGELTPLAVTPRKLYAMTEDPASVQTTVTAWLNDFGRLRWETQDVAGRRMLRIWPVPRTEKPVEIADQLAAVQAQLKTQIKEGFEQLDRRLARLEPHRAD